MGLIRRQEAPAAVQEEANAPARDDKQPSLETYGDSSDGLKVAAINAVIMSPLIANLALTVSEDKRGELIEKYYDLALRLIRK